MPHPAVSARAIQVIASPMRKYTPLIRAAEARGVKVLKLHIGDPDFTTPPAFFEAIAARRNPQLPYAPSSGIPAHVDAWKNYYAQYGIELTADQILPTAGGAEARS